MAADGMGRLPFQFIPLGQDSSRNNAVQQMQSWSADSGKWEPRDQDLLSQLKSLSSQ